MALIKEEHFGIARKIVSNMTTESWCEIPHAIVIYEADVTDILPVVKALNANCKSREEKITLNTDDDENHLRGVEGSAVHEHTPAGLIAAWCAGA